MTTPCMGGWCRRRDGCPNYAARNRANPAERLCIPGRDGQRYGAPRVKPQPIEVPDNELPPTLRGGALEVF